MLRLSAEAKVGIFVLAGLILLAYMAMRVGKFEFGNQGGYELYVYFETAAGLAKDSSVEIAGVEVGRVKSISLENDKAKIVLSISKKIKVRADAQATIRTKGVLGDKYVEIMPSSRSSVLLKDGSRITKAVTAADVDKLLNQLSAIGGDVKRVSSSFSGAIGGEEGKKSLQVIVENLRELTTSLEKTFSDNNKKINEIVSNLADFSRDLKGVSSDNKTNLNEIIATVKETSGYLREAVLALTEIVAKVNTGRGTIGKLVNEEGVAENLNDSLGSLKEISNKINKGDGTIGKLVNEYETVKKLNTTLGSINDYLQKQDTFRTFVKYRGEYLFDSEETKSYLSLKIQPKEDKYYLLQVVDDPAGRTTETTTRTTVGGVTTVEDKEKTNKDTLKFSAEIAKRYYDLTLRGGIIESTGGLGLDYHMMQDRLIFSFDAFDFDPDKNPHLKIRAEFSPIRHLYIAGGLDDFISDNGNESVFLGGGIRFSDEDLKTLISNVQVSPAQ